MVFGLGAKLQTFGQRTRMPPTENHLADRPIIVRRSVLDSGKSADLVLEVIDFVNFAIGRALFNREEIAPNAMRAYRADYYLAQVNNGGHWQYAGNSGMHELTMLDCQQGLEVMGHAAADIHADFLSFARNQPTRFEAAMATGRNEDATFKDLNQRFYAANRDSPMAETSAGWLRSLPELRVVDDVGYPAALAQYAATNVHAADRKVEREKARHKEEAQNPILQAIGYLCLMVEQPRTLLGVLGGRPGQDLGDGIKVVRWTVNTDRGPCSAFFHPSVSMLLDDSDARAPREIIKLPTEMVVSYVKDRTGKDLFEALLPLS